jgi:hypothetical protein
LQQIGRLALVQSQVTCVAWIEVGEFETIAFCDAKWMDVFLDAVNDLFSRHGPSSLFVKCRLAPVSQIALASASDAFRCDARCLMLALFNFREMSDLSPQSGPKRTLIRALSPFPIL